MTSVNPGPAITSNPNSVLTTVPVNTQQNPSPLLTNGRRLIAVARAVPLGSTGDAAVMPIINSGLWTPDLVILTNASASLTTATAGIFTGPAGTGTAIVAGATALSSLTGPTVVGRPTVVAGSLLLNFSAQNLYFNLAAAQAGNPTMDVFIYGFDVT